MMRKFGSLTRPTIVFLLLLSFIAFNPATATACTGITLKAEDGTVVYGRTCEWGSFDLNSRLSIIPRGYVFTSSTPEGKPGLKFKSKYGVVGVDALNRDVLIDGINEKGLAAGAFFHPGFASYQEFKKDEAGISLDPIDVVQYLLTQYSTVDEVRKGINKIRVVPTVEPSLGEPAPFHWIITQPDGKAVVIEYLQGKPVIFDNPLGVITNSPAFDWHLTNLRNYVNLSPVALPGKKIEDLNFKPLGAGSGMIGLPGDFTPPSRFVRAVAFTQTARHTPDGGETIYELFRILDNFNVPLGASEGSDIKSGQETGIMRSSTPWTTAIDTKNLVFYYHTQNNRRVREFDLKKVDFGKIGDKIIHIPLDKVKNQDTEILEIPK